MCCPRRQEGQEGLGGLERGSEPRSGWGQASGEGLTSGKPQSHCSPGSTNIFPQTVASEGRLGSRSKRQLPIPSRRAFSRACWLQLLKFRPGRKLGMGARKVGAAGRPPALLPPTPTPTPQRLTLWKLP